MFWDSNCFRKMKTEKKGLLNATGGSRCYMASIKPWLQFVMNYFSNKAEKLKYAASRLVFAATRTTLLCFRASHVVSTILNTLSGRAVLVTFDIENLCQVDLLDQLTCFPRTLTFIVLVAVYFSLCRFERQVS